MTTDEELLSAIVAGDQKALATLYRRHAPWLAGRLASMTSSRDLTEEALQDTFVSVWHGAGRYRGEGPVAAWLWGIGRRRLISLARRRSDAPALVEVAGPGPEEVVLEQEEAARVRLVVSRLPEDQRGAIEAVVFQGLSVAIAAAALGVPEGTVKSRLHRARARIKEELRS